MDYRYDILLGKISRVSGYDGSVIIRLEKSFHDNIPEMESVFIEINRIPVPFFISYSDYSGGDLLKLQFDGYETYDRVKEFVGCRVFLTSLNDKGRKGEKDDELIGYKILNEDSVLIGTIAEIIKTPGHDLLKVTSESGKEILIPFHEDFIVGFEPDKKSILVVLPEGLTEIN